MLSPVRPFCNLGKSRNCEMFGKRGAVVRAHALRDVRNDAAHFMAAVPSKTNTVRQIQCRSAVRQSDRIVAVEFAAACAAGARLHDTSRAIVLQQTMFRYQRARSMGLSRHCPIRRLCWTNHALVSTNSLKTDFCMIFKAPQENWLRRGATSPARCSLFFRAATQRRTPSGS
jgi:hypothetical protein